MEGRKECLLCGRAKTQLPPRANSASRTSARLRRLPRRFQTLCLAFQPCGSADVEAALPGGQIQFLMISFSYDPKEHEIPPRLVGWKRRKAHGSTFLRNVCPSISG